MGGDQVKREATEMLDRYQVLPRLVVFDLDYTLWPFYCECLSKRDVPSLYPQAKSILYALKDKGVDIAVASRSPTPDIANTFLEKLGIKSSFVAQHSKKDLNHLIESIESLLSILLLKSEPFNVEPRFLYGEIFSSWTHKTDHFQKLKQKTGVPYGEMLFFDDENRNIQAVSKMGVTSILVDEGVDLKALRRGLAKFSENKSSLEKNKERWRSFSQKSTSSES